MQHARGPVIHISGVAESRGGQAEGKTSKTLVEEMVHLLDSRDVMYVRRLFELTGRLFRSR